MDNKRGFTLIELLIVVVIIGILAAIAIPRFGETRERAFVSSMTSDLRNVQTLQEQFYFDEGASSGTYTYAEDVDALNFTPSAGVTVTIASPSADGYSATATHTGAPGTTCTLTVGEGVDDGISCGDTPEGT